jgi:hypothetical protein
VPQFENRLEKIQNEALPKPRLGHRTPFILY